MGLNAPDKPIAAPQGAENTDSDTSDTKPEWKPTSRAFRRAAKKGNFDLKVLPSPSGGNRRTGGKKKW